MPSFADMHVPEATASARRAPRGSQGVGRGRASAEKDAAEAAERLLAAGRLLQRAPTTPEGRAVFRTDQQVNDAPYRERWAHDKVVRSTHGVNCTGSCSCSCSWQVYVKDGLITWETQATDYPSTGPDRARAARRSPGTPTRRPGSATRMREVCWWKCSVRRKAVREGTPWRRGRRSPGTRTKGAAISRRAARAARSGSAGARHWRSPPPRMCTRCWSTGPTGSRDSRRSRRCRWPRTRSAPASTR